MIFPARRLSITALLALHLTAVPLYAQDASPAAESAVQAPDTFLGLIIAGGPLNIVFISILGLFSLVALAVIFERLVNLRARKLMPPEFIDGLQQLVRREEDNPQAFLDLCDRHPSVIANILKAGLQRAGRPLADVEKAMEDAADRELGELRSRVRPLTVLSSAGPLVGLLGTAVGMILVFRTASQVGLGKAELLAEGIYLKLETTVAGLVVAVPCVLFGAVLNSRSEKFLRRIAEHLTAVTPCFIRMEQGRRGTHRRGIMEKKLNHRVTEKARIG